MPDYDNILESLSAESFLVDTTFHTVVEEEFDDREADHVLFQDGHFNPLYAASHAF